MPEGLHPHSFRATFGHNTNLWAVREGSPSRALATLGAAASLAPLDYDVQRQYFVPGQVGSGRRPCAALEPKVQVGGQGGYCGPWPGALAWGLGAMI